MRRYEAKTLLNYTYSSSGQSGQSGASNADHANTADLATVATTAYSLTGTPNITVGVVSLSQLVANVGIGTSISLKTLDVNGDINFTGNLYQDNVIFNGGGGGSSQWSSNIASNTLYYTEGNVGIGITIATEKLQVNGGANFQGNLRIYEYKEQFPINLSSGVPSNYEAVIDGTFYPILGGGTLAYHTLIIDTNDNIWAWGWNASGQLGNNDVNNSYVPINISSYGSLAGCNIIAASCGENHSLALDNMGKIHSWGYNGDGELGNSTSDNSSIPIEISSYGSLIGCNIIALNCGRYHSLAIDNTGKIHAWGWNDSGQLGNNKESYDDYANSSYIPINISSYGSLAEKTIVSIRGGDKHTLALDNTGAVHAWGFNDNGQLGNNTTNTSLIPIEISSYGSLNACNIIAISAGYRHSLALDNTGKIHVWGINNYGQLGNNTNVGSLIPIEISSYGSLNGCNIIAISGGYYHTLALDNTSNIHAWGANYNGQLGNNQESYDDMFYSSYIPINISSYGSLFGTSISRIMTGADHSLALDNTGKIHSWGYNGDGELGNNTQTDSLIASMSIYETIINTDVVSISISDKNMIVSGNVGIGTTIPMTTLHIQGDQYVSGISKHETFQIINVSDESTDITIGTSKITFRAPFAMTLTRIPRASVNTVSSSGTPTVDIKVNTTSIFSTLLSINENEKSSITAATPAVLSTTSIANDDEITVDITTAGTGAKGLKIILYYRLT